MSVFGGVTAIGCAALIFFAIRMLPKNELWAVRVIALATTCGLFATTLI